MCPALLILLDFITQMTFGEECVLKEPRSLLHPQCERPSFTSTQKNVQNYSSLYLNLHIFI